MNAKDLADNLGVSVEWVRDSMDHLVQDTDFVKKGRGVTITDDGAKKLAALAGVEDWTPPAPVTTAVEQDVELTFVRAATSVRIEATDAGGRTVTVAVRISRMYRDYMTVYAERVSGDFYRAVKHPRAPGRY